MRDDGKLDDYLVDPAAPVSEDVQDLERRLAPLRFDAEAHPLPLAVPRPRPRRRWRSLLAAAAMVGFVVAGGAIWLWTWPSERSWPVIAGPAESLPVGRSIATSRDQSLLVRVARIGWMRVGADSQLTLLSTRSNHHRLEVTGGTLHVSIWAPPRSVAVRTPSGEVIDFGCEFIVRVDPEVTVVDVVSGWVRLDNAAGEVLVPGGASSVMTRSGLPSVPLFSSATPRFKAAVQGLESGGEGREIALATAIREARRRDVLTLLRLAERIPERDALLTRAAELMPPRGAGTLARARRGEAEALETWAGELPLPPRNWVPNWRDRLPFGR